MAWTVVFSDAFWPEFEAFGEDIQDEILAHARLIETYGPHLGRPYVDTLKGSRYRNMKEIRMTVNRGEWRVAFAFAPDRNAVVLVAADKRGISQTLFYSKLISRADERFAAYVDGEAGYLKGK